MTMSPTSHALFFRRLEYVSCLLGSVIFMEEFCVGMRCDDTIENSDLESTGVVVK